MTNDIEKRLARLTPRLPSARMDERMENLFDMAQAIPPPWWARSVSLWQCAVACGLCVLAGWLLPPRTAPPPSTPAVRERVVYIVQPDGPALANFLDATRQQYPHMGLSSERHLEGQANPPERNGTI